MRIRFTATSPLVRATRGVLAVAALAAFAGASSAAEPAQPEGPQPARHHFSLPKGGSSFDRKDEVSEVKLTSVQSDGRFSVLDEVWHPGFKVPPHFHKEHAEVFYVIAGQVEWTVGGETHLMGPGALVYIPPDTVHSVKVVGDKDYRGLMFYEPGGYEYNIYREQEYTKEQQEQPEIQKKLRALGDFNPVEKK
jgi:quercetin dioxygenase-like cupin family protein